MRNAYSQKLTYFSYVPVTTVFILELDLKMEVEGSFEAYVDFYTASHYWKQCSQRCENPNFLLLVCFCSYCGMITHAYLVRCDTTVENKTQLIRKPLVRRVIAMKNGTAASQEIGRQSAAGPLARWDMKLGSPRVTLEMNFVLTSLTPRRPIALKTVHADQKLLQFRIGVHHSDSGVQFHYRDPPSFPVQSRIVVGKVRQLFLRLARFDLDFHPSVVITLMLRSSSLGIVQQSHGWPQFSGTQYHVVRRWNKVIKTLRDFRFSQRSCCRFKYAGMSRGAEYGLEVSDISNRRSAFIFSAKRSKKPWLILDALISMLEAFWYYWTSLTVYCSQGTWHLRRTESWITTLLGVQNILIVLASFML